MHHLVKYKIWKLAQFKFSIAIMEPKHNYPGRTTASWGKNQETIPIWGLTYYVTTKLLHVIIRPMTHLELHHWDTKISGLRAPLKSYFAVPLLETIAASGTSSIHPNGSHMQCYENKLQLRWMGLQKLLFDHTRYHNYCLLLFGVTHSYDL
jgi:hypothetical protein